MFQTEFCGSNYKFILSWDNDVDENYSINDSRDNDRNLFSKLNELYDNISKFTSEFVDCVKHINNTTNTVQLNEINPNVSFKVENLNNAESRTDEVYLLKKEVEKLRCQKEQVEADYKTSMLRHEEEISKLRETEMTKLRKSEDQFKVEMSDLRIYFENSYTDSLKQLHEVISNQYTRSEASDTSSNSEQEVDNVSYKIVDFHCGDPEFDQIHNDACKLEVSDESRIKIKENINKDLQNIIKAYNTQITKFKKDCEKRKNDEIKEYKRSIEVKYSSIIDSLQSKINHLLYDKALEDRVKEVHRILKEESLSELNNMHNEVDEIFFREAENDRVAIEQKLKSKFQDQLSKLSSEWKSKSEDLLSDVIVDSAVKTVIHEVNCKSTHRNSFDILKDDEMKHEDTEEANRKELDELKIQFEDRIQIMSLNFEQNLEKLSTEKEMLLSKINKLEIINDHLKMENETLKANFVEELKILQSSQDIDVDKMEMELKNIRKIHDVEIFKLKEENSALQEKISTLEEKRYSNHERRSNMMSHLLREIEELISRERNGDYITWPSDLAALEQIFSQKFCLEKSATALESMESEKPPAKIQESDDEIKVDDILQERDALRKVNVALQGVVKVFTKYLTNCEEELNNTLINELVKTDCSKRTLNNSFNEDSISHLNDMNFEEAIKKVHFAPDISELLTSLRCDFNLDLTSDRNVSVLESELNACLERLKNEAAAVLCLTNNKKIDVNEVKATTEMSIQTELNYNQLETNEKKIQVLEKGLSDAETEIANLHEEVVRLTDKINSLESIEGYGEGFNAPFSNERYTNNTDLEIDVTNSSDEFCPKCDKIIEEAKREIEDRQAQVQAADNKLKSLNQFLERQTTEREHERSDFDKKIEHLQDQMREQERDFMFRYETETSHLLQQIKKLSSDLEQSQNIRDNLEIKLKSSQAKIVKLTEHIDELDNDINQKSDLIRRMEAKLREKEEEFTQFQKEYKILIQQLECLPESNIKQLEELNEQHVITSAMIDQVKNEIFEVEKLVINRTRELEKTCLLLFSNSIISSPSEDVSVCDRIAERVKITSPSGSDLSSPIHVPINQLSCLHEKIKRLFRAEEATMKKIQDQDLQLNKLSQSLSDLELERDTLRENLSQANAKLSETKTELNNWQHGHTSIQSDIQLELSRTIESLESKIEYLKKSIDQKDEKIRELTAIIKNLEGVENEMKDKAREMDLLRTKLEELQNRYDEQNRIFMEHERNHVIDENKRLEHMLEERDAEIKRLQQKLSFTDGHSRCNLLEGSGTPRRKRLRVSFAENSGSFSDSDVSRNVAIEEISALPHYLSIASSEVPHLKSNLNESLPSRHSVKLHEKLDVERFVTTVQLQESNVSDAKKSCSQTDHCYKQNKNAARKSHCILENNTGRKNDSITLPEIAEVSAIIHDHKFLQDAETSTNEDLTELQNKFKEINEELNRYKEQTIEYECKILALTNDVEMKSQRIHKLMSEQEKLEKDLQGKCCEIDELRQREIKFDNLNKSTVEERIETQFICEEYSRSLQQMEERLTTEQSKSTDLEEALQQEKSVCIFLREKVSELQNEINKVTRTLELTEEKVKALSENNAKLEEESRDKVSDSSILEGRTSSLRNLTEKVQKEVERAEELDKNILKSLECDSRGASFIDELLKISSSLSENLKQILFKMLQKGPEGLSREENNILIQSCGRHELNINDMKLKNEREKQLRMQLEVEKKSNRELINDNRKIEADLSRLGMILNYYEERNTFLHSKLDEYRNRAVKIEIELTSERTSRRQLEISFESYKKEMCDQRIQNNKKSDEYVERLSIALNENIKLKREIDSLKNMLEVLTAELNSVKIITQYHSDSESDISRSLNPLKVKLNEVQEKYTKVKHELEVKKDEMRELKSEWNVERANYQKLENLYKVALEEKHELQQNLMEIKMKFNNLTWQKQKMDDKLRAVELYEMKRRKARAFREGNMKKEHELAKAEQIKLDKECKRLRENLIKIADEHRTLSNDWKRVCEEMQKIFYRMMKAEKNQRSLTFQKTYLMQQCQKFREEFVTLTQSNADATCHVHDFVYFNITNNYLTGKRKFKSFALCLVMIRRIQFLVKRRITSNHSKMVNYFQTNLLGISIHPWCKTLHCDDDKTETTEADTYKTAMKSNEFPFKSPYRSEKNDLQSLYNQFTSLRETYITYGYDKLNI